ncbi:MAG: hypothetical protein ACJAVA_000327 [Flavobacteriaceae bacterium]|jgi:hypothetical protein
MNDITNINKNHKDVLNWLRSELAQETKNKLTKIINKDKIELLKLIIKKLNKN